MKLAFALELITSVAVNPATQHVNQVIAPNLNSIIYLNFIGQSNESAWAAGDAQCNAAGGKCLQNSNYCDGYFYKPLECVNKKKIIMSANNLNIFQHLYHWKMRWPINPTVLSKDCRYNVA